jgi:ProP effector
VIEPRSKRARIAAEAMFMRPKATPLTVPTVLVEPHARPTLTLKKAVTVEVPVEPKPKPKARTNLPAVRATVEWMAKTWPAAFARPIRPLAVGAGALILAARPETIPLKLLHDALRYWVRSRHYQQALAAGVRRVNLDGSDAGEVSQENRAEASRRLAMMLAKAKPSPLQKKRG